MARDVRLPIRASLSAGVVALVVLVTLVQATASAPLSALVTLVQATASAPLSAHGRSSHGMRVGHALKMIWGPLTLPGGASAFPVYRRLGVQVLQLQLSWAHAAPARPADPSDPLDPAYRWPATLDAAIRQAATYGIRVALLVKDTPAWANGGRDPSWAPTDPLDYARFLQAVSRRYPSVRYWMVWGEVTRPGNFNPMPPGSPVGPERYARLLDAAYGSLKQVSRSNLVIGGMTYTVGTLSAPTFIRLMRLPDGRPPRLDYFGHNPYSARFPDLAEKPYHAGIRDINDIDTLEHELAAVYRHRPGGPPKLWLSEFSVSSDHVNRGFAFYVSRQAQAHWLTAAYRLADSVSYVAGLGWYQLLDEPANVPGNLTNGLMSADGVPKPAFFAYEKVR